MFRCNIFHVNEAIFCPARQNEQAQAAQATVYRKGNTSIEKNSSIAMCGGGAEEPHFPLFLKRVKYELFCFSEKGTVGWE